jgi:hypothetical protein
VDGVGRLVGLAAFVKWCLRGVYQRKEAFKAAGRFQSIYICTSSTALIGVEEPPGSGMDIEKVRQESNTVRGLQRPWLGHLGGHEALI